MSDFEGTIRTVWGAATIGTGTVSIVATDDELIAWSRRSAQCWPCSVLARLDGIRADFDANGLCDIFRVDDDPDMDALTGDELSAWSSDVLRDSLPPAHPCYFVTVGQYL